MNAFELLKADHKKVAELFDRLEEAPGKTKLDIFKEIKRELDLHSHVEEKFLYPALEKSEKTHDLTLEAYEEHKVVKTLLAELSGTKTADDEWQAKAKVLRENVEHHVEEEEGELFDKAENVLSDQQIEGLGNKMEAEKARKQGRQMPARTATKSTAPKKLSAENPGILARIADFVGLGGATTKKTAPMSASSKSSTKKSEASKSSKAGAKTTYKKNADKSASATKAKPSPASKGSVKAAKRSSGAGKKRGSSKAKSVGKKRSGR